MIKKIVFQDSFLVSGIMCHQGCGATIQKSLIQLNEFKHQHLLPADAQLIVDAEPQALGIHRLFITIESEEQAFNQQGDSTHLLSAKLKERLNSIGFDLMESTASTEENKSTTLNWSNILINLMSILAIIILSVVFPPSLPLAIGLTALSFLTTAFTARSYLINFYHNLTNKNIANMETPVTVGWLLSLAHTLYHVITMPNAHSFSMTYMSFIMPIMLIAIINGMDEVKRLILNQSKKMHLKGMRVLFPHMSEEYSCYELLQEEQDYLSNMVITPLAGTASSQHYPLTEDMLPDDKIIKCGKNTLKKGMVIKIKQGECFPVDGIIIKGSALIDASILTGEPQQTKKLGEFTPAGSINLGEDVIIYAIQDCYNSTVNKLLFRSNRAQNKAVASASNRKFVYFYTALILIGIIASIAMPFALNIFTLPLVLQNITGILFAICPCTIAIAHQLPKLLGIHRRNNKGILLRDENLTEQSQDVHTLVFDKTGTLTTGNSRVDSSEGISPSLWQRIYLLEKHQGGDHPIAQAINRYYEAKDTQASIIQDIKNPSRDSQHRGLSAFVQGRLLHIGNLDYLQHAKVALPKDFSHAIKNKLAQGYTPVYVAEDTIYQGVILIKHEIRPTILAELMRLKSEGKKLIMLTGDSRLSAIGFNQQNGAIFNPEDIHAEHTPQDKEQFLQSLMSAKETKPSGIWFVGDGLNDAPCARVVTEKGGASCSITGNDKAAFFTDMSLNGSLNYLFKHNELNQFLKKTITQNQWLLAYGAMAFLAFIISFSIVGIAVSPLIPMIIMVSTTLFTLFNSYRVQLSVDNALDNNVSWLSQWLASDLSIGLLVSASALLMIGVLISTAAAGGLILPVLAFTAGTAAAISSVCIVTAGATFAAFSLLGAAYLFTTMFGNNKENNADSANYSPLASITDANSAISLDDENKKKGPPLNVGLSLSHKKCTNESDSVETTWAVPSI